MKYMKLFWQAKDWFGLTTLALCVMYMSIGTAPLFHSPIATWLIGRFHLRTESFLAWSATQPIGWMYTFDNKVLVSPRRLAWSELAGPPAGLSWRRVNHQNSSSFLTADARKHLLQLNRPMYFYLESTYRGTVLRTAYRVVPSSEGVTRALWVEPEAIP